jgi:hydrogenase-4 component E
MHLTKKNDSAAIAYGVQSLAVVAIMFGSFLETRNVSLLIVILMTLAAKVFLAPIFLIKFIKKHKLAFSANTYLGAPFTLIIVAVLAVIANSYKLEPLTAIVAGHKTCLSLALASMFVSLFLIVNHKEAISQILGVLSLENSIVAFAIFAGLEQSASLQLGIIFDICVWFVIAVAFMSMIYKYFGSLDVTSMKDLKEE